MFLSNATIPKELIEWANKWQSRTSNDSYKTMRAANPRIIPRNHIIETILAEYNELGSSKLMSRFLKVANKPYLFSDDMAEFQEVPSNDTDYKTFCGT